MANLRIVEVNQNKYYYIEHTIRKGDRFENKRIYLGKKLPKNIDKIKEKFDYEIFHEIYAEKLKEIKNNFQKEFSKYPESAKEKYIESFMIKFTYNTNRIEGSTLTLKETADLLQDKISPNNKSMKEIKEAESHKKVFYEMLRYGGELNIGKILYWHKLLFNEADPEIAGKIRKHTVSIARSKVELALPAEIDSLLHEFFSWYRKKKDKVNPVILAAMAHLKFVTIHPFSDGNGRISRLIMNFILNKHGYPMINIEYVNRKAYYNALEKSQLEKKGFVFVMHIIKKYFKSYSRFLKAKV
jgi:Fic family protein